MGRIGWQWLSARWWWKASTELTLILVEVRYVCGEVGKAFGERPRVLGEFSGVIFALR
jgi:hypothetical protein